MTLLALALILAAAVFHATWNLLAKRVTDGGAVFVWLFGTLSALLYAPLAVVAYLIQRPTLGAAQFIFIAGSAALHIVYFVSLQRGYRLADLSLVYPLARGTGPTLATFGAILIYGERPTPLALAGAALIIGCVFVMGGGLQVLRGGAPSAGVAVALWTGCVIATYTLWDKHAVSALLVPPLILDWGVSVFRALLLAPLAWRNQAEARRLWTTHRLEAFGVAVLSPLAYILVLSALRFTPVSYVAPGREVSILVGALLGIRVLREGEVRRRMLAASGIVAGVICLAIG